MGVVGSTRQRGGVGRQFGARHLELHHAGVGQPNVRRRLVRHLLHHAFEHLTRVRDLRALERLERGAPFYPGAMRRQQRVERLERFAPFGAAHLGGKPVAPPGLRFDVGCAIGLTEQASKPGDRLLEAVVGHRDALPGGVDERILRQHLACMRDEQQEQLELARRQGNRRTGAQQLPRRDVELVRSEEQQVGRHVSWIIQAGGGSDG